MDIVLRCGSFGVWVLVSVRVCLEQNHMTQETAHPTFWPALVEQVCTRSTPLAGAGLWCHLPQTETAGSWEILFSPC